MSWEIVWQRRPGIRVVVLVRFKEAAMGDGLLKAVARHFDRCDGKLWIRTAEAK
jgi:hypothetical protein